MVLTALAPVLIAPTKLEAVFITEYVSPDESINLSAFLIFSIVSTISDFMLKPTLVFVELCFIFLS